MAHAPPHGRTRTGPAWRCADTDRSGAGAYPIVVVTVFVTVKGTPTGTTPQPPGPSTSAPWILKDPPMRDALQGIVPPSVGPVRRTPRVAPRAQGAGGQ